MNNQSESSVSKKTEIISFRNNSYSQNNGMYDNLIPLLPPVHKPDRLFQIFSDEMSPEYPVGSIVGAKRINLPSPFIIWGETYLIDTINYGTIMRRVNTSDIPGCIRCYANQHNYDPLDIQIDSITDIYKIILMVNLV